MRCTTIASSIDNSLNKRLSYKRRTGSSAAGIYDTTDRLGSELSAVRLCFRRGRNRTKQVYQFSQGEESRSQNKLKSFLTLNSSMCPRYAPNLRLITTERPSLSLRTSKVRHLKRGKFLASVEPGSAGYQFTSPLSVSSNSHLQRDASILK